ncbi:Derlin-2 [Leucoagaricus sp. SymC.cos]|nr:Derlin-2 [Leucoagaricus sp. SymC.cos]
MDQFLAEIRKIPPVTRFITGSSLAVTIPVLMNMVSPYTVLFVPEHILQRLQKLWRLHTSFFLGPELLVQAGGISYIFELVMLYRTADQLESGPYAGRSADLAWQLLFVGASIIGLTRPLGAYIFSRPFLVALAYLSSSLAPPGAQTSLFGLVTLPIQYFPYVMIGMDLLMGGPATAALAIAGAVAGHAWLWGVWGMSLGSAGPLARYARAPRWLADWLDGPDRRSPQTGGTGAGGARMAAGGVHVVPPRRVQESGSSSGYNWGAGRRLGN